MFGSWLGSYHKYCTYLAIFYHTNIEIPMEWSQLTRSRLIQIWSGGRLVVYCISKQIDFFQQVLGLGWVYLSTEGIILLAGLTES
jgi:hypothetical protein